MSQPIKLPTCRNKRYGRSIFCINDSGKQEERESSRRFLDSLFSEPSKFEE